MTNRKKTCITLLCTCCILHAMSVFAAEKPELTVGIVSDVHINLTDKSKLYENRFRRTLKFFDDQKCDAVLGCGDWIEFGWHDWFRKLGECWFEAFPEGRRSDGEPIEKCFIFGDHEIESFWNPGVTRQFTEDYIRAHDIPTYGRGKLYEEVLKEPWAPIMRKRVKGYDFVLGHYAMREGKNGEILRWGEHVPGLAEFFRTNAFDKTKPFFYAQHKPPKGTCIADTVSTADDGTSTEVLRNFPNCLAFCGHKHRSATCERNLWQGAFTCVEVPALQNVSTDAGHENGSCSCDGYGPGDPPHQMKKLSFDRDGGQFLLAKVYRDRIVLERWNAVFLEKSAEDWVIPFPLTADRPASFESRAKQAKPPAFARDAAVRVTASKGSDRTGASQTQFTVTFPPAKSDVAHDRAADYLVTARLTKHHWTRISCEKWVYSEKCCLPEKYDTNMVTCVFSKAEIPGPYETVSFTVTPYNAYQQAGEPIESGPISPGDIMNYAKGLPVATAKSIRQPVDAASFRLLVAERDSGSISYHREAPYAYHVLDSVDISADVTVTEGATRLTTRAFDLDGRRIVAVPGSDASVERSLLLKLSLPEGAYRILDDTGVLYLTDSDTDTWSAAKLQNGVRLTGPSARLRIFEIYPKSWPISPTAYAHCF